MKKVGIVTIYDQQANFGNRLQNYAVQMIFKSMGFKTETYCFEKKRNNITNDIKKNIYKFSKYKLTNNREYWENTYEQIKIFERFNKETIPTFYCKKIDDIKERCDYYAIGSDQVWNTMWYDEKNLCYNFYFLRGIDPNKKICISPSFGTKEINKKWMEKIKNGLLEIKDISVREQEGVDIVYKLIGIKPKLLPDPTLIIDKDVWDYFSRIPNNFSYENEEYVLTYILGDIYNKMRTDLEEMIVNYKVPMIDMKNGIGIKNNQYGPREFVYLIKNAKYVVTDSFHACVFSIIFKKPFIVYKRDNNDLMIGRIMTLLDKFDLKDRLVCDHKIDFLDIDFSKTDKIIENERKIMYDFILKKVCDSK